MPVRSKNLLRAYKQEFIPASHLSGIGIPGLYSLALTQGPPVSWTLGVDASTSVLGGASQGVVLENVNSTGTLGLKMSTDTNYVLHDFLVPGDYDQAYPLNMRLVWCTESTTLTHGSLFTVTRKAMTRNTTALSATISTALDTPIPADLVPVATAYAMLTTNKGVINANTLTAGEHQLLKITQTTKTGATNIWLLGLEYEYVPTFSGQLGKGGPVSSSTWV